jgi:hypothetical protein
MSDDENVMLTGLPETHRIYGMLIKEYIPFGFGD